MAISFTHPNYLFFLVAIPAVILIHFASLKYKKGHALRFANFDAISRIKGIDLYSKNVLILFLTIAILVLIIFSLSGMTIHRTLYSSSFSFVIAIDSSKSMEANDMVPNRMEAAKKTAINFVESSPAGSRIGIISFSGNSFIEQEVTEDKSALKRSINNIEISSIGGTDLYDAIVTSTNLLKPERAKAVILLSDGQINVGNLDDALEYADKNDVVIHSIAIGTKEGGMTSYGLSKVDEDSLKASAYNTGGKFFRAVNEKELSESFNSILTLKIRKVSFNLSPYLMIASIVIIIIDFILINTRYRTFP